jgi:ABC-type hemin transport system substrate-binding protein
MATEKLAWIKVDPTSLPETLKAKFAALEKARKAEQAARQEFEAAFISASQKAKKIPAEKTVLFGYRFGGLAVAMADKDGETKSAKSASAWF